MQYVTDTLALGTELNGRFRVEKVLACGNFCITYLARDNARNDFCVVRELYPEGSTRTEAGAVLLGVSDLDAGIRLRQTFVREAKTLAKLSGRGVIAIRAAFSERGTAYLVRDYVEGGQTLNEWASITRKWEPSLVENLAENILTALNRVHQLGLLHEDIRPSNILMSHDGTAHLIDFGAARQWLIDADRKHMDWLGHGFAAPECLDLTQRPGPESDLYALARTLSEAFGSAGSMPTGLLHFCQHAAHESRHERPKSCDEALQLLRQTRRIGREETPLAVFVEKSIQLAKLRFAPFECPECLGILERPTPLKSAVCPVCRSGRIVLRPIEANQCPNCRQSPLGLQRNEPLRFCPICRDGTLTHAKAGLFKRSDVKRCGACSAEFVPTDEGLKLKQEDKLPRKVKATQSDAEWRAFARRSLEVMSCPACDAQYDVLADGRWLQVSPPPSQLWSVLTPEEWSRVAAGLNPDSGNAECEACGSDYFATREDLTLTFSTVDPFGFAEKYLGRLLPLKLVANLAVGKHSEGPCLVCVDCNAEYEESTGGLRLVHSDGELARWEGQVHTLESWHRLARGLPLESELDQFSDDFDDALRTAYETGQVSFRRAGQNDLLWRGRARRWRETDGKRYAEPYLSFAVDSRMIQHGGLIGRLRIRLDALQQATVQEDRLHLTLIGNDQTIELEIEPESFEFKIGRHQRKVELRASSLLRRLKHVLSHPSR